MEKVLTLGFICFYYILGDTYKPTNSPLRNLAIFPRT